MKQDLPALSWPRRLSNCRGAVFLLTVYFASLMLLVLGGISLQRTMTETRSGQISRDQAQAFYLAEGAFDSALFGLKGETPAKNTTSTSVPTLQGEATYAIETVSANLTRDRQQLVRRISATGQNGRSGTQQVYGYFEQEGPLVGVYGKRMTVAHSSLLTEKAWADEFPAFLEGSLSAGMGALASSHYGPPVPKTLRLDGVAQGDPALPPTENEQVLQAKVSEELRSLKSGYMYLKGLKQVDPSSTQFAPDSLQDEIPHATGAVSSGVMIDIKPAKLPSPFKSWALPPHNLCSENLVLPAGKTDIYADTLWPTPVVPGTHIYDGVGPGEIAICVNAIIPDGNATWLESILESPPEVVFHAPVTIYVTGGASFDVSSQMVSVPGLGSISAGWAFPLAGSPLFGNGTGIPIQTKWQVSVGAKISAQDPFGTTIPNGVKLVVTKPINPDPAHKAGIVWLKPGRFSGSVYAPDSLVLVRERDVADRTLDPVATAAATARKGYLWSKGAAGTITLAERIELAYLWLNRGAVYKPLELQSLVGDEVVMEMGSDHVQIKNLSDSPEEPTVTLRAWTTGP